jgi:hypothetical protein
MFPAVCLDLWEGCLCSCFNKSQSGRKLKSHNVQDALTLVLSLMMMVIYLAQTFKYFRPTC